MASHDPILTCQCLYFGLPVIAPLWSAEPSVQWYAVSSLYTLMQAMLYVMYVM